MEYIERKNREKEEQISLKKEDAEVEYKRRLIERFSYKNTDLIKRIYAENQVTYIFVVFFICVRKTVLVSYISFFS